MTLPAQCGAPTRERDPHAHGRDTRSHSPIRTSMPIRTSATQTPTRTPRRRPRGPSDPIVPTRASVSRQHSRVVKRIDRPAAPPIVTCEEARLDRWVTRSDATARKGGLRARRMPSRQCCRVPPTLASVRYVAPLAVAARRRMYKLQCTLEPLPAVPSRNWTRKRLGTLPTIAYRTTQRPALRYSPGDSGHGVIGRAASTGHGPW